MLFVVDLQSDTEYKVRVLAGTSVGFPKLSESQWPWLKHRTPKHNEGPKGSLNRKQLFNHTPPQIPRKYS